MRQFIFSMFVCLLLFGNFQAHAAEATSYKGVVGWFDNSRGFGFITPSGGIAGNVFVHFSAIIPVKQDDAKILTEGQQVLFQFRVVEGQKRATWVKVIK